MTLSRSIAAPRGLRLAAVLTILATVALVAVAGAAQPGSYKGQTEQNRKVLFKLRDGKVRAFNGGINLYCFNGIGEPSTFKFDAVIPPRAIPVRNGRFDYDGKDRYRQDIQIHGRFVSRRKAKGWIEMGAGNCSGKADFTATRRSG